MFFFFNLFNDKTLLLNNRNEKQPNNIHCKETELKLNTFYFSIHCYMLLSVSATLLNGYRRMSVIR